MSETSRLACPSINGDADIDNVLNTSEERIEVSVSHFEGHVADKEGLGGRVEGFFWSVCSRVAAALAIELARGICSILDSKTAAFEELLVQGLDGFGGGGNGFKIYISKSADSSICASPLMDLPTRTLY